MPSTTNLSLLAAALLVIFMQTGFALMVTGLCRAKNAAHAMSMTFLGYALGVIGFVSTGYALSSGHPLLTFHGWGILGKTGFFLSHLEQTPSALTAFIFTLAIINLVVIIPAGALAERWSFKSFCFFSLFVSGLIAPVYACWIADGGWLAQLGVKAALGHGAVDFAGSSTVHMQGGLIALICSMLLGPRIGKFDEDGNPRPILGHHMPMVFLGTFILALGWFGFNVGPALLSGHENIGLIAVNTLFASAAGALTAGMYMWLRFGKPDPSMMCNGMLAGLVSISAGCAFVSPWASLLIGCVGSLLSVLSIFFWDKRGVDDPVGAISVHGIGGLWGMLALGLFANALHGDLYNSIPGPVAGLFYGNPKQLLAQLIAIAACALWDLIVAGTLFWLLGKILGTHRVPAEVEIAGLDIPEMGAPGYPEFIHAIGPEQVPRSEIHAARAAAKATLFQWSQS